MTRFLRLLSLALLLLVVPAAGFAQTTADPTKTETQEHLNDAVQQIGDRLTGLQKRLESNKLTPSFLSDMSNDLTPLIADAQALVDRLTPRVAAIKAPLDQLGPKPDKDESPEITKERATLQAAYDQNDGLLKRAKASVALAQKFAAYIAQRQRTLFAHSLFQRSTSLLSPPLWSAVISETPANLHDLGRLFGDWIDQFNRSVSGLRLVALWGLVFAVLIAYWPLSFLARRYLRFETKKTEARAAPTDWQKILVASWTAVSTAGLMIGIMYAVVYVFSFFHTPEPWVMPLYTALQWGIVRIALAAGLSRAVLAPDRSAWRMVTLDDRSAAKLARMAITVAVIVSAGKLLESLNEIINASVQVAAAARGAVALVVAGTLVLMLANLGDDPEADHPATTGVAKAQRRDLFGIIRGLAWTVVLVIVVAVLVGYIPFASFLTDQLMLVAAVGAVLYLAIELVDQACTVGLQPNVWLGRTLIYTVGLRRETLRQITVLLAGLARLVLLTAAALAVAAPWGMQSSDVSSNLDAVFFGFKVGDVTISVAGIAVAILSFIIVLAVTHAVQNWLEDRYLPTTHLDSGLRNSIKTSLGYCGFILALALAAANLGVDFQKLAIVAGALSVGIGFGLQSIVNNFVSGLILLWERAIRVGDWVVVGADQGYVRKINVRSTEIETFDRAAVIVPNSNLVSGVVKNLMRTDRVGRLAIDVSVNAASDPEKVREVLLEIARDNEDVLSLPSPQVRFTDLTASTMTFNLFCFVADVESMARTKSDLYFEICRQFRQQKFFDGPAPDPTRIALVDLDRLEAIVKAGRLADESGLRSPRKTG